MRSKGKSIALFSSKGGTGKSTMAVNLAGSFSLLNKKVLIIDFDTTGGAIAAMLNIPFEKTIYNIVEDLINNKYKEFSKYVTTYNDNIDVLAAPKDPRQGSRITSNFIETILEKAVFEYDVVICDTNHYLGKFNVTLLDKVDNILLYHGSKAEIQNELTPHVSLEGLPLVYATNDWDYALIRAGKFTPGEVLIREEHDIGKHSLAEVEPGAFDKVFNRPGYIYEVNNNYLKNWTKENLKLIVAPKVSTKYKNREKIVKLKI